MLHLLTQYLQLDQTRRLRRLNIANQAEQLLIEAFTGQRGIDQHGYFDVIALGTDASMDFEPLIGQQY